MPIAVGINPTDEPLQPIPREEWEARIAEIERDRFDFEGETVTVPLMIELPFWLLIPDGQVEIRFNESRISAAVSGNHVEVCDGPMFFDSRANTVFVGPESDLTQSAPHPKVAATAKAIFRRMKTVITFQAVVLKEVFLAWHEKKPHRVNQASHYFSALAFAHIPFVNRLITSYRVVSLDPYAFEVSEWDLPIWWTEFNGALERIGLMPYRERDRYPAFNKFGTSENQPIYTTTIEAVQEQSGKDIPAGKLELLDAHSLNFRGSFSNAVRSAVTAIEVALESRLACVMRSKGYTDEQIQARLSETRGSFYDRLKDYERLANRLIPGPIVSIVPYINGVRLRNELDWVRGLRHQVVHEGTRIDAFQRGTMQRAMDTMTWLFNWLSLEEPQTEAKRKNGEFYSAVRGQQFLFPVDYTPDGVRVRSNHRSADSFPHGEDLLLSQYAATLNNDVNDLELFAAMTCEYLAIEYGDGVPVSQTYPLWAERFLVKCGPTAGMIFCVPLDGLLTAQELAIVGTRVLANGRLSGFDLKPVCIVHHQKHIPPELRETDGVLTDDICALAEQSGIAIHSAIDLQLLVRGAIEHRWDLNAIRDAFFYPGRHCITPPAYRQIGTYRRFFPRHSAMSVILREGETIKTGDKIGIRLLDRYFEQIVTVLHVEHQQVRQATGPCWVGVQTTLRQTDLREGQAIFCRVSKAFGQGEEQT